MDSLWLGMTHTGVFDDTHRAKDWDQKYTQLFPVGAAKLSALLSLKESTPCEDPETYWWEDVQTPYGASMTGVYTDVALSSAYTSGTAVEDTVLYVKMAADDAKKFRPGLELMFRDSDNYNNNVLGKCVDVVINGASSYLAVKLLEADGSGPGDISDADYIFQVGDVNPEGGYPVTSRFYERTAIYNYLGIFKETYDWTRTEEQTKFKSGNKVEQKRAQALRRFNEQREFAFLFSKKTKKTSGENGSNEYTTGGITRYIQEYAPDNIADYHLLTGTSPYKGKAWTDDGGGKAFLDEYFNQIFSVNTGSVGEKLCLCDSLALNAVDRLLGTGNHQMQVTSETNTLGWRIKRYRATLGDVLFVNYGLFNLYGITNTMLLVEPQNLTKRIMQKTKHHEVTPNGMDGKRFEFLSQECLAVRYPQTMGWLRGVGLDNEQT